MIDELDELIMDLDDIPLDVVDEPRLELIDMMEGKAITLPMHDLRKMVTLAKDADKLFDFTSSGLTPTQQMYIIAYATRGTKSSALKVAGVPYSVVSKWEQDKVFNEYFNMAMEATKDALEEEMLRRAMNGSDKLLIEAMKAMRPDKYNRRMSEVSVNAHVVHSWAELAKAAIDVMDDEDEAMEIMFEEE